VLPADTKGSVFGAGVHCVETLVTATAKHLKVIESMVVFAKVFVMRVAWITSWAKLTTVSSPFPSEFLYLSRPTPSVRNLRLPALPHRVCVSRLAATETPVGILR
jgi:hypothetical protein